MGEIHFNGRSGSECSSIYSDRRSKSPGLQRIERSLCKRRTRGANYRNAFDFSLGGYRPDHRDDAGPAYAAWIGTLIASGVNEMLGKRPFKNNYRHIRVWISYQYGVV